MKKISQKHVPVGIVVIGIALCLVIFGSIWLILTQISISSNSVVAAKSDQSRGPNQLNPPTELLHIPLQPLWSERLFNRGVALQRAQPTLLKNLVGGVLPHHQVGNEYIADLLSRIDPTTTRIIWLTPDHFRLTRKTAFTTPVTWQTPFGEVPADAKVMKNLQTLPEIETISDMSVAQEHALSGMVPYIAYYLPQAQLVPLAFNPNTGRQELDGIIAQLQPWVSDTTVVIASVDFSHDLPKVVADKRDTQTWQAISAQDWESLLSFNDEYLDSPSSVYVASQLVKSRSSALPQLLNQDHSSAVLNEPDKPGTSYLEIGWEMSE